MRKSRFFSLSALLPLLPPVKLQFMGLFMFHAAAVSLADDDLPPLPRPDKRGRFPAEEYARVSLARDVIRSRRQARLSQQQLADLAGIRQETLSRIETGKHKASVRTIEKLEQALKRVASKGR